MAPFYRYEPFIEVENARRQSASIPSAFVVALGIIASLIQLVVVFAYDGKDCTVLLDHCKVVSVDHNLPVSKTYPKQSNEVSPEPDIFRDAKQNCDNGTFIYVKIPFDLGPSDGDILRIRNQDISTDVGVVDVAVFTVDDYVFVDNSAN